MTIHFNQDKTSNERVGFFARTVDWFARAKEVPNLNLSRRAQIEELEQKTDAELAAIGVRRDQIAYHVYNDLFYA